MKVLGVSGSPKEAGNTDILLDSALRGVKSTGASVSKIRLNDLNFKPCQDCDGCSKTGICVIKDDMELIYRAFESSDGIILASPVFFGSVSAQLKSMIDRFHCTWIAKNVLGKKPGREGRKGIFLCTAGQDNKKHFDSAKGIIKRFFNTLDIDYSGELFTGGYNFKEKTGKTEERILKEAFDLGAALAKSLK